MADPQDRPDEEPDGVSGTAPSDADAAAATPPAAPAKNTPPAKKLPAGKAPAKKAVAKKAPAKAAKKAPAKKAAPPTREQRVAALAQSNGAPDLTSAAKEAAAQAKSTVDSASNPVTGPPLPAQSKPGASRLPLAAAVTAGLLAILAVLIARRHSGG